MNKMLLPAALVGAITGFSQTPVGEVHHRVQDRVMTFTQELAPFPGPGAGAISFIAAGHADGKVVKNAPYSAEAVTETTRILADGTRIVNRNTTTMARDKDGRTRRENDFGSLGAMTGSALQSHRFATITDPAAKETTILNLHERTAEKVRMGEPMLFSTEHREGNVRQTFEKKIEMSVRREGEFAGEVMTPGVRVPAPSMAASGAVMMRYDSKNAKAESLGHQMMEGVDVEGTRTTMTIPAGEIGNDRAIVSVTERWYSPELQMVIFNKTTDPQFGESIYRVSNLKRGDPDPGLFRVPAEFKIREKRAPMMIRRKLEAPPEQF